DLDLVRVTERGDVDRVDREVDRPVVAVGDRGRRPTRCDPGVQRAVTSRNASHERFSLCDAPMARPRLADVGGCTVEQPEQTLSGSLEGAGCDRFPGLGGGALTFHRM